MSLVVIQGAGPHSAASFPISDFEAFPVANARLVQIVMLCLQRDSMTFVLREFAKKPTLSERTTEMIMWSSSLP